MNIKHLGRYSAASLIFSISFVYKCGVILGLTGNAMHMKPGVNGKIWGTYLWHAHCVARLSACMAFITKLKLDSYFLTSSTRVNARMRHAGQRRGPILSLADALWISSTNIRIRVQIAMASISVGWAWPSQTHLIGWDINAGLESLTRLNSSAYVRVHTRVYARRTVRWEYERFRAYARVHAHEVWIQL